MTGLRRDGRDVYQMESVLPKDPEAGYYCHRIVLYLDFMRSFPIGAEVYDFDNQLRESYFYTEIKLNPGLTDRDFDPKNPEYRLD